MKRLRPCRSPPQLLSHAALVLSGDVAVVRFPDHSRGRTWGRAVAVMRGRRPHRVSAPELLLCCQVMWSYKIKTCAFLELVKTRYTIQSKQIVWAQTFNLLFDRQ
jgi:hypothetical protein